MGTFAQAQDDALGRREPLAGHNSGLDMSDAQPGEVVVLSGDDGKEMMGTVFYMSGGGKGPAGKSKAKFKSEMGFETVCRLHAHALSRRVS